jgi:pimeloyl-ACP methyl ester carboxylesterase
MSHLRYDICRLLPNLTRGMLGAAQKGSLMQSMATFSSGVTEREAQQVEQANASGRTPVVFIHGLWLLPSSWDRWADLFEKAGYAAVTPS